MWIFFSSYSSIKFSNVCIEHIISDLSDKVDLQLKNDIKLDYESQNKTNICIIIANDKGSPKQTANATVVIQLTDENDNAPKVHNTPISGNVTRFAAAGKVVISGINATDEDSGINQEIKFDLGNLCFIII